MNTTDEVVNASATFLATVDFPEPDPPAIPIIKGLVTTMQSYSRGGWNALCARRVSTKDSFSWI